MKFVIFGIGKFFENRKGKLFDLLGKDRITAYIDNKVVDDTLYEDVVLCNPIKIQKMDYDRVLLMSCSDDEMEKQLLEYGVLENKIIGWEQFVCEKSQGKIQLFTENEKEKLFHGKKRILIITHELSYSGGSVVAAYASMALQQRNHIVWIATPRVDMDYVEELVESHCNIAIVPSIPYIGAGEKYLISGFDLVLVNVFPMIKCACDIAEFKPTLWWIHESSSLFDSPYQSTKKKFPDYCKREKMERIYILAVSEIAKQNFEDFYPNRVDHIMPFGIKDEFDSESGSANGDKFVFAIIGGVNVNKGQLTLVRSLEYLKNSEREEIEVWVIGSCGVDDYSNAVRDFANRYPEIKILNKMSRGELQKAFLKIDSVICASLEETMSIAIVEGMMNAKICITTDRTGIAQFIHDGINGFVCEADKPEILAEKIKFILNNKDNMGSVKERARETYLKYFELDKYGERLESELLETEKKYYQSL